MVIREATQEDVSRLYGLIHSTIDKSYKDHYCEEAIRFFHAHHSQAHILNDILQNRTLLLEEDGTFCGTVTRIGTHVKRFFILPEKQGSGFGTTFMTRIENDAQKEHVPFLEFHASLPSIPFYQKKGYVILKRTYIDVEADQKLPYARMAKQLTLTPGLPPEFQGRFYRVVQSTTKAPELDYSVLFESYQSGRVVYMEYRNEGGVFGEWIGWLDGNRIHYTGEHAFHHKAPYPFIGHADIIRLDEGRIRLDCHDDSTTHPALIYSVETSEDLKPALLPESFAHLRNG
jgi:GNAT superfamily N-acetyltransferase